MIETKSFEPLAGTPVFASDYVNHSPVEFSLTTMINDKGERQLAITFTDHVLLPSMSIGATGEMLHGVKIEKRYRSTILLSDEMWTQIATLVEEHRKQVG